MDSIELCSGIPSGNGDGNTDKSEVLNGKNPKGDARLLADLGKAFVQSAHECANSNNHFVGNELSTRPMSVDEIISLIISRETKR